MSAAIVITTLCSVFADPSFYMSSSRQAQVCQIIPTVVAEAEKNNIDPFLLMGLITVESNWKSNAVSHAGACGLTQVMPKYTGGRATGGKKYTCDQLKVPKTGVKVGARVLAWWIKSYGKGDVPTGLCGYFAGYRCKPPIRSGANYSAKVLKNAARIHELYTTKSQARTKSR